MIVSGSIGDGRAPARWHRLFDGRFNGLVDSIDRSSRQKVAGAKMRSEGFFTPPKRNTRISAADARSDEALIMIAGDMFAAGFDTKDISIRLVMPEAAICAALEVARNRRRLDHLA